MHLSACLYWILSHTFFINVFYFVCVDDDIEKKTCRGLGKLVFITMELWAIEELDPILRKCGYFRFGTPSNLKVLDSVKLYKKLPVLVII